MPEARRLAIVGYGKMGKLIEQFAPGYGFEVALKLDEFNNPVAAGLTAAHFKDVDVAIEFSIPAAVPGIAPGHLSNRERDARRPSRRSARATRAARSRRPRG